MNPYNLVNLLAVRSSFPIRHQYEYGEPRLVVRHERICDDDHLDETALTGFIEDSEGRSDINQVSDAEALLACRAYLQRRKRWGPWVKADRRKSMRQRSLGNMRQLDRAFGKGFFWEDPSQLKYLNKKIAVPNDLNSTSILGGDVTEAEEGTEETKEQGEDEEIWESVKVQGSMGRRDLLPLVEDDRLLGEAAEEFSPLLHRGPSQEHVRRSEAVQKLWGDPEWKARWYEMRWGRRQRLMSAKSKAQKRIEARLRKLDPSVLENEALANMTEVEITAAVLEYVKWGYEKKKQVDDTKDGRVPQTSDTAVGNKQVSALDLFVLNDDSAKRELQKLQKERSERSRKAYQSRLEKLRGCQIPTTMVASEGSIQIPSDDHPEAARSRIEDCLDRKVLPATADVIIILQPARLSRRKSTLLRILSDGFGLRGKCIPMYPYDAIEERFQFASKASIRELGEFVLSKLTNPTSI